MTWRSSSTKKQIDTSTTHTQEEQESRFESSYAMQQAIRKPGKERLTSEEILQLQGTIGNTAVQRLLSGNIRSTAQPKNSIKHPSAESQVIQRVKTGQVRVEGEETYLFDANNNESFGIRGSTVGLVANTNMMYVVKANEPFVAILCGFVATATDIILRARDNAEELGKFTVEPMVDRKGGSNYLTHMSVLPALQGQGVGKDLLRFCIQRFGQFRIGTEPNMQFFQPVDPEDKIELTEDGDGFITKMLAENIITHSYVFPMDHMAEYQTMIEQQPEEGSGSDEM